jgi:hypothetical protein
MSLLPKGIKIMQKPLNYEDTEAGISGYQPEVYLRPGANLSVFVWLALLGLPAVLLFLVYSKAAEKHETPIAPPAMHLQQPAHP